MTKENGSITVFLADHKLYFSLPKITGCDFLLHKFLRYFGLYSRKEEMFLRHQTQFWLHEVRRLTFWRKVAGDFFVLYCYLLQNLVFVNFKFQMSLQHFVESLRQNNLFWWFSLTANKKLSKSTLLRFSDWSIIGVSPLQIQTTTVNNFYQLY